MISNIIRGYHSKIFGSDITDYTNAETAINLSSRRSDKYLILEYSKKTQIGLCYIKNVGLFYTTDTFATKTQILKIAVQYPSCIYYDEVTDFFYMLEEITTTETNLYKIENNLDFNFTVKKISGMYKNIVRFNDYLIFGGNVGILASGDGGVTFNSSVYQPPKCQYIDILTVDQRLNKLVFASHTAIWSPTYETISSKIAATSDPFGSGWLSHDDPTRSSGYNFFSSEDTTYFYYWKTKDYITYTEGLSNNIGYLTFKHKNYYYSIFSADKLMVSKDLKNWVTYCTLSVSPAGLNSIGWVKAYVIIEDNLIISTYAGPSNNISEYLLKVKLIGE